MNEHAKLGDGLREPLRHWDAPADVASLHPEVGPWKRQGPWAKGRKRGTFEARYSRDLGGMVRVASVPATAVRSFDVVLWAIETAHEFLRYTRGGTTAADVADISVDRDNHGEATEEQYKTRGRDADETPRNAVEATHDTSFRPKDHVGDKLIKSFGIRDRAPQ